MYLSRFGAGERVGRQVGVAARGGRRAGVHGDRLGADRDRTGAGSGRARWSVTVGTVSASAAGAVGDEVARRAAGCTPATAGPG